MDFEIIRPGPGRLIRALIDELQIIETINNQVRWDPKQWKISPGELIAALIITFFCQRHALYKVCDFYKHQDLDLLFGRKDLCANDFNDDCLARSLDRLEESEFHKLYGLILVNVRKVYQFQSKCCHADTTSIVVFGDYDDPNQELVDYGFSKDKRFDLKQIKSGLCVNSDGFPIHGEPINGNKDDKTWSGELLTKFKKVVNDELTQILVADSALITIENLKIMYEKGILFISRLPDNFGISEELKLRAWRENNWQKVGRIAETPGSATYQIQEFTGEIEGRAYRFVVVNSSSLDKRKEKSIRYQIEKEEQTLTKGLVELAKTTYACQPDAEKSFQNWFAKQKPKYHYLQMSVVMENVIDKRNHRGRPRRDEAEPTFQTVYRLAVKITGRDEVAIQKTYDLARTFILISNTPEVSGAEILRDYKDQFKVEQRFGFLKDPYYVGPLLMKKEERLKGLHHVLLLTLLIYCLFERRVRLNLKEEKEPFHVAGSYKTFTPSGRTLLENLDEIHIAWFATPGGMRRELPRNISAKAQRLLRLVGYDAALYVTPPLPPTYDG
jgi:transposase